MKKILIAAVLMLGFGGYIYWNSRTNSPAAANPPTDAVAAEPLPPVASRSGTDTNNATNTAIAVSSAIYKDGTFIGDVASTIYGNVQVAAVISGGKIADIKMLKYPNDRENSTEISKASLPILKKEAIAVQSAQVDIVSGATQTAEGFQQSLGSALTKAQS